MIPRFHDPRTGRLEELSSAAAPRVVLSSLCPGTDPLDAWRCAELAAGIAGALRALGWTCAADAADSALVVAHERPESGHWLRPAPIEGVAPAEAESRGFCAADRRLALLRVHYRTPASLAWPALEAGRRDRLYLSACRLRAGRTAAAPHATGLAGYRLRFRRALAADFDAPAALETVWDALRPGALSPASQLAALEDLEAALGPFSTG